MLSIVVSTETETATATASTDSSGIPDPNNSQFTPTAEKNPNLSYACIRSWVGFVLLSFVYSVPSPNRTEFFVCFALKIFGTREIREQVYDEKNNAVTIKVACCSPEKIRDKLCYKGGKTIKSIEIVEPPKPKPLEKSKEPEKRKEPKKPKETKKSKEQEKPRELEKPKARAPEKPKEPQKHKTYVLLSVDYLPFYPQWPCCGPCSEGYSGGPCYHGYGRPPPSRDGYGPYETATAPTDSSVIPGPINSPLTPMANKVYDEKNNAVTIKVACCSPEKIRDKLCNKGGKTIKSIEIVEPSKPKPFEKSVEPEKRKEPEKPKKTKKCKEQEKPEELQKPKAPALEKPKEPEKHKTSVLVSVDNLPFYLHWPCCGPCSEGYSGGPCYHGYGRLPSSPPSRDGYGPYGCSCGCGGIRGCGCGCGGNRGCRKVIKSIEIKELAKPKPKETEKAEEIEKPESPKEPEKSKNPVPIPVGHPPFYLQGPCCGPCYEGYGRGPCYHGYGRPPPPPLPLPRPRYDGYGHNRRTCTMDDAADANVVVAATTDQGPSQTVNIEPNREQMRKLHVKMSVVAPAPAQKKVYVTRNAKATNFPPVKTTRTTPSVNVPGPVPMVIQSQPCFKNTDLLSTGVHVRVPENQSQPVKIGGVNMDIVPFSQGTRNFVSLSALQAATHKSDRLRRCAELKAAAKEKFGRKNQAEVENAAVDKAVAAKEKVANGKVAAKEKAAKGKAAR
ncbi:hypothetical protein RJ640_010180 [Escallonia rubra]|uniref:Uncharacterized protein n=1 Tax=Escallonia rubra TaxID=112253 RepID=A0AA88R5K1_9ASTE|nr:hypothetical protein RJ640_010180 [Escallonia rubra]